MLRFKRILAAVVDFVIICLAAEAIALTVSLGDGESPIAVITYIILCLVFALFKDKALGNASIGKKLFKLCIIEKGKDTLSLWACIKRWLTYILIAAEIPIMAATGQRLGDRWAKTSVEQRSDAAHYGTGFPFEFVSIIKYIIFGAILAFEFLCLRIISELKAYGILVTELPVGHFPWNALSVFAFLVPVELALFFLGRESKLDTEIKKICRFFFVIFPVIFCIACIVEVCII